MRIIENSKASKKINLQEFNNFANKPTEFLNFICILCRKYNMKIYKIVKTYSEDKNMGVQLNAINGHVNIFYNYNKRVLEFEIEGKYSTNIESDIIKYAETQEYIKSDKVMDQFGNIYILNEDVGYSAYSKKISVTKLGDKKEYFIYSSSIVPCIDE